MIFAGIGMSVIISELLDSFFTINGEMIEDNGEDCYFFSFNEVAGILSVFDGCGGLGAMKYTTYKNKTGAFVASRVVALSVKKWFNNACENEQLLSGDISANLKKYIDMNLSVYQQQGSPALKIKGSMVRPFPTTMAAALLKPSNNKLEIKSVWAGDSRVYLLDNKGLAQLSADDIYSEDALSNLTGDGVLTNVISADGKYSIHTAATEIASPCVVFTATDGCFGYIPSPMQFEYLLLLSLHKSKNIVEWKQNIETVLKEVSGDDHTMCMAAFGFGNFNYLKKYFSERFKFMHTQYAVPLDNADDALVRELWKKYRKDYYRHYSDNELTEDNND